MLVDLYCRSKAIILMKSFTNEFFCYMEYVADSCKIYVHEIVKSGVCKWESTKFKFTQNLETLQYYFNVAAGCGIYNVASQILSTSLDCQTSQVHEQNRRLYSLSDGSISASITNTPQMLQKQIR